MASKAKVSISSSSIPANANVPLSQSMVNDLTSALLSVRAIPRIQAVLQNELATTGWTTNLRAFVLQLLRSGECTTYDEVMARVLSEVKAKDPATNGTSSINGKTGSDKNASNAISGKSVEEGGIRIPEKAVKEGIKAVRKELEEVCEIVVDED